MKYRILPQHLDKWQVEQSSNGKNWEVVKSDLDHENEAESWIDQQISRARKIKKRIEENPPRLYPESPVKLVK